MVEMVEICDYIAFSVDINKALGGRSEGDSAPFLQQAKVISGALSRFPLPEKMTTYRGFTNDTLQYILKSMGAPAEALNQDGTVSVSWLLRSEEELNAHFRDKPYANEAFTSTTMSSAFAKSWADKVGRMELTAQINKRSIAGELSPEEEMKAYETLSSQTKTRPGVHNMVIELPEGTRCGLIDRAAYSTKGEVRASGQLEILLRPGSILRMKRVKKQRDEDGKVISGRLTFFTEIVSDGEGGTNV